MRGADGTPCPMHRGGDSGDTREPANPCVMRGTCDGPMAAMVALLSQCGVLANAFSMTLPDLHPRSAITHGGENPLSRLASPEPPPPRA
jgi:hypothetical protein